MVPEEIAELTAEVNRLDRETARRVARLVFECNASLRLALSAVQEANNSARIEDTQAARTCEDLFVWPLPFWNKMNSDRKHLHLLSARG